MEEQVRGNNTPSKKERAAAAAALGKGEMAPPSGGGGQIPEPMTEEEVPEETLLHVADLRPDVDEATLHEIFSTAGKVGMIQLHRGKETQLPTGYASIGFPKAKDAEKR